MVLQLLLSAIFFFTMFLKCFYFSAVNSFYCRLFTIQFSLCSLFVLSWNEMRTLLKLNWDWNSESFQILEVIQGLNKSKIIWKNIPPSLCFSVCLFNCLSVCLSLPMSLVICPSVTLNSHCQCLSFSGLMIFISSTQIKANKSSNYPMIQNLRHILMCPTNLATRNGLGEMEMFLPNPR